MGKAYMTNCRDDCDLPSKQITGHDSGLADGEVKQQASTVPDQGRGKRGRRRGRSSGKNRNQQGTALTGQDQTQETAELLAMTPAKREAATIYFWTNATPATLFGFSSNAEILATNVADETRNRSTDEPLLQTIHYQKVHRPVEKGESPFDHDMSYPRATAILGGFVGRRQDVGKKRKDWVKERYIFTDKDEELATKEEQERETVDIDPKGDQIGDQKELTPNGLKKWKWYGKKLREDAKKAVKKKLLKKMACLPTAATLSVGVKIENLLATLKRTVLATTTAASRALTSSTPSRVLGSRNSTPRLWSSSLDVDRLVARVLRGAGMNRIMKSVGA